MTFTYYLYVYHHSTAITDSSVWLDDGQDGLEWPVTDTPSPGYLRCVPTPDSHLR